MKYVIAILKGILVGLAVLIPGVSGGSMIMTMGIYEQAISITSRDRKVRRAAIVFLIPYVVGIVVGILGLAFVIKWLMERYLFETALCFIGMILGSLPMLYKKVKGEKFSVVGAILALLMVVIMIALPHLSGNAGSEGHLTVGGIDTAVATLMGLLAKEEIVAVLGVLDFAGMGKLAGYSFLIFNLLCAPCFAAMGAIRREMNSAKWTAFAIGYQCAFAFSISLIVYQLGSLFGGNGNVIGVVAASLLLLGFAYFLIRPRFGNKG